MKTRETLKKYLIAGEYVQIETLINRNLKVERLYFNTRSNMVGHQQCIYKL